MTAFAVFLLSLFVGTRRKAVLSVGCRSPPFNLEISQNFQIGGTHYVLQQSKRRNKMPIITRHKPSYIPTPRQKKEEEEKLRQKLTEGF